MEKVRLEPFNIIGIAVRTTNEKGQAAKDIPALWQQFMNENVLSKIPDKIDDTIYSLYTNYEGDHTQPYTTIIGCRVKNIDSVPEGMMGQSFDGGNYLKMTIKGNLAEGIVTNQWLKIWEMNDLDRIYTVDFDVYGEKAQDPLNAEIDTFVAIR